MCSLDAPLYDPEADAENTKNASLANNGNTNYEIKRNLKDLI